MKNFLVLSKIIMKRNSPKLLKGGICFFTLFFVSIVMSLLDIQGALFCQYLLLFFPFLYIWYFCSTIDLQFYNVYILTRNVDRVTFYWSYFCSCLLGLVALFFVAIALVVPECGGLSFSGIILKLLNIFMLLSLDYVLLVSISYCFCIMDLPIMSFLGVLFPALMVFKSEKIIAFLQVNYSFPLLISSLKDLDELYQFIGGLVHVAENVTCALAFLWICQYFYKNKDLVK